MDERDLLIDTVDALLTTHCGPEVLQAARGSWAPAVWKELEQAGLTTVSVAADLGGGGGALADTAAIVRLTGRHAAPVPLAESALVALWLGELAGEAVRPGPAVPVLALGGELTSTPAGGGWTVSGSVHDVPWARIAQRLVLAVAVDDTVAVGLVDGTAVDVAEGTNIAGEPRDTVTIDGARVVALDGVSAEHVRVRAALARTGLMVGAMERVLDLSMIYAVQREQFGRPLARFQVIRHYIAEMAGEVAAARAGFDAAVDAVAAGDGMVAVAAAKVRAGRSAGEVAGLAHQIHGAIGFTDEHVLHHSTTRLWAWRDEDGTEAHWAGVLGRRAVEAGAAGLWSGCIAAPPLREHGEQEVS